MNLVKTIMWGILLIVLMTQVAIASENGEERYVLTGKSPVRISVDLGWQRDGLVPVRVEMQGISIELMMDKGCRVFDGARSRLGMGNRQSGMVCWAEKNNEKQP